MPFVSWGWVGVPVPLLFQTPLWTALFTLVLILPLSGLLFLNLLTRNLLWSPTGGVIPVYLAKIGMLLSIPTVMPMWSVLMNLLRRNLDSPLSLALQSTFCQTIKVLSFSSIMKGCTTRGATLHYSLNSNFALMAAWSTVFGKVITEPMANRVNNASIPQMMRGQTPIPSLCPSVMPS